MKNTLQICRFSILKTFTVKLFLTIVAAAIAQQMFAQITDNFSDGDFTSNPPWQGTSDKFIVNSQALQLMAPAATDAAYLTTPYGSLTNGKWEFLVRMSFNPSGTNYSRIYLLSDQTDLTGPLTGYFVQVGSENDDVSLWKQTGTQLIKMIDGADKKLDLASVTIRINVIRSPSGDWELYSDISSSGDYNLEGSAPGTIATSTPGYFGILCQYTATRADKFFFDDFFVSGAAPDTVPPGLMSIDVVSATQIRLAFSEILDSESAENVFNYAVDYHYSPSEASLESGNRTVLLSFGQPFTNNVAYLISASGIKDAAGNIARVLQRSFTFLVPASAVYKDVIVTEILAHPNPVAGLPESEFAEIFNRSPYTFDLAEWTVTDGSSIATIPHFVLSPGEYVILTSDSSGFNSDVKILELPRFPSLNNTGDMVLLRNPAGLTIDSVNYTTAWYKDLEKSNGGWSMELIDPENICGEGDNWTASDQPGGTPGKQNSVFANKPDLTGPRLQSALPLSSTQVRLTFNEKLQKVLPSGDSFLFQPPVGIRSVTFGDGSLTTLILALTEQIRPDETYSITVTDIYDCSGNLVDGENNRYVFGLPEPASPGDIVVNEILFNPRPLGTDFVEFVNISEKFINLKDLRVTNGEDGREITSLDILLSPGSYVALTENAGLLASEYPHLQSENVLVVDDLPAFPDENGAVVLIGQAQQVIDSFFYSEQLHSPLIRDTEGVALERISFTRDTNEKANWKSASSVIGFATPGFFNSMARPDVLLAEESVIVVPEAFIPVSGEPDFTQIHYKLNKGGYVANVKVYDQAGHHVKTIANNELLAAEGILRWDGDRDDGNKTRVGYYMIWFEIFDESGRVKTFRKRLAVSARF